MVSFLHKLSQTEYGYDIGSMILVWGACFMKALEEIKTTVEELFVALGNIIRACSRLFFTLHQNFLLLLFM
jgi:hypothetical protein